MPRRSELFTEDPYYLPRYCGYLPQFKYRIGKTYGRHSVEILTDDNVHKSGRYVLTPTEATVTERPDERRLRLRSRGDSWGNQNYTEQMVPGYTGYIPKKQHYFANTYGEMCRSALSHHEEDVQDNKCKQTQLKKVFALQSGALRPTTNEEKSMLTSRYTTPLTAQAKDAKRYRSPQEFRPYGSPYFMENDNSMKWFKSGYTGFVPRTRELISLGYPVQSNKGLNSFTDGMKLRNQIDATESRDQVSQPRRTHPAKDKTILYPNNIGMVPHYTGYIPGYKYMIGHTYGQHTYNTLKLPPAGGNGRSLTTAA